MKYVHTNIISQDWRRLADFYIQTFDCQLVPPLRRQKGKWLSRGIGIPNAALEGCHLRLPGYGKSGPTLEIYQYQKKIPGIEKFPNSPGLGHIAFEVENVDVVLEKLRQKGGSSYGEITTRQIEGVGVLTFVYARDPDGNFIELQHWSEA